MPTDIGSSTSGNSKISPSLVPDKNQASRSIDVINDNNAVVSNDGCHRLPCQEEDENKGKKRKSSSLSLRLR